MNNFNISRINTDLGIFRISGLWCDERLAPSKIDIESIEVMGTDGWALLNLSHDDIINLIKELTLKIIAHLQVKSQ